MASPKTSLPDVEAERIIEETLRRVRLRLPGWLGDALSIAIAGGGGGIGLPVRMLTDDGSPMIDDLGNPMYVG